MRFVLGLVNSRLVHFYWLQKFYDNKETFPKIKKQPLHSIPVKRATSQQQKAIIGLVEKVCAAKQKNPTADTSALEREINQQVYALYGLTAEEIKTVERATA